MEPLGSKGFLQPGKDKHDIFTGARMAHKTYAPDASLDWAEASSYLQSVIDQ
jgi:hypothetical protein